MGGSGFAPYRGYFPKFLAGGILAIPPLAHLWITNINIFHFNIQTCPNQMFFFAISEKRLDLDRIRNIRIVVNCEAQLMYEI